VGVFCRNGFKLGRKVDECKPLPHVHVDAIQYPNHLLLIFPNNAGVLDLDGVGGRHGGGEGAGLHGATNEQGLILVHLSAQRKRFLWSRGCIKGLFRGSVRGIRGYQGLCRVLCMLETTQVELKSRRAQAPAYEVSAEVEVVDGDGGRHTRRQRDRRTGPHQTSAQNGLDD